MNKRLKLIVGMLFIFVLTGSFGEDYDVGVPTAHLHLENSLQNKQIQLTKANISWSSYSGDVEETIDNIEKLGLTQDEIRVFPNQEASLEFKEKEENGGDIWSDPTLTATLWKNGEQIDIELDDNREFQFPLKEGTYVLEVKFIDSEDSAQYVANIVIEKTSKHTKITDGKLPEFTLMEMPSIKKIQTTGDPGVIFDNSYSKVCWNDCTDNRTYNYPDIHSGDVEVGDELHIDWHNMKPDPTEINLLQINPENYEIIEKESISITNTTLGLKVDEENIGVYYSLEFLWKEGNDIKGKSIMNFKLNN
ncbi:hypothetical protein JOC75_000736 [Metabacillus crassostreae]|uniref:hypothetical protein n=1 Tax=Metabacillus crassostreae TaxID=929098 RepID=UPI0019571813|nr:hypothetical protein [Metabacillus crassostreae]MBM7602766.1 hypothetical protein [Metabacillus crassostreae]